MAFSLAFDSATNLSTNGTASSHTFAHTCGGTDRILFVGVYEYNTDADVITGVTYNGVAMTRVGTVSPRSIERHYLYCLAGPAAGTHNVVISASGAYSIYGRSASYTGARQSSTPDATMTAVVHAATLVTGTLTPIRDRCWTLALFVNEVDNNAVAGAGTTLRAIDASNSLILGDSNGPISPPASTSLNYTWSGSADGAVIMASFGPFEIEEALRLADTPQTALNPEERTVTAEAIKVSDSVAAFNVGVIAGAPAAETAHLADSVTARIPGLLVDGLRLAELLVADMPATARDTLHLADLSPQVERVRDPSVFQLLGPDVQILIDGVDRTARVDVYSVDITDELNEEANRCTFDYWGPTPARNATVVITTDGGDRTEFSGRITRKAQRRTRLIEGRVVWQCTATDGTYDLDGVLISARYAAMSATAIALAIMGSAPAGFTTTHIALDLPIVDDIQFTKTPIPAALRQLADAIGGDTFVDYDNDVWFFLTAETATADALTTANLHWRNFHYADDTELYVNRVLVEGRGGTLQTAIAAAESIIPLDTVVDFDPAGGLAAIQGTDDIAYTGLDAGGGGALVGPGFAPSVAPTVTPTSGSGLESGIHKYAYTWVTGSGESLPSPLGSVDVVGAIGAPATPAPHLAAGSVLSLGTYSYKVTLTNASGETLPSAASAVATAYNVAAPANAPILANDVSGGAAAGLGVVGDTLGFAYCYGNGNYRTPRGPFASILQVRDPYSGEGSINGAPVIVTVQYSTDPNVSIVQLHFQLNGGSIYAISNLTNNPAGGSITVQLALVLAANPIADGFPVRTVTLTVPTGVAGITGRKVYRTAANGSTYGLAGTIANNTAVTFVDATPDASLGAAPPSAGTCVVAQVALADVAIGPATTTQRKVYRTVTGGAQLKLQQTIADNTATTGVTDATPDASLGANAPTGDTSGLTQPTGQVLAGSTSLLLTGAGAFRSAGGWAKQGGQVIRYTGITGNTLTGIPEAGLGAIQTTIQYNATVEAVPSLLGVGGAQALQDDLATGETVSLLVQVDDTSAQAVDPVRVGYVQDRRLSLASADARGQTELLLHGRERVTAGYTTDEPDIRSGRAVPLDMVAQWGLPSGTYTIQRVRTYFDPAYELPQRDVTFSSATSKNLYRILRALQRAAQIQ